MRSERLWRIANGELNFRRACATDLLLAFADACACADAPEAVVLCIGANNIGRDGDGAEDTYLGIVAVIDEILHRLPGTRVILPGILPRGGGAGGDGAQPRMMPPPPGESTHYQDYTPPAEAKAAAADGGKFAQPGVFSLQYRK